MSQYKDFINMIDIISYAMEIQGRAEDSFRRSARNATTEVARNLFSEIADDFGCNRERLQKRKQKLLEALSHLRTAETGVDDKSESSMPRTQSYAPDQGTIRRGKVLITERDPVCDMQVNEEDCKYVSIYKDAKYFFCCEECQRAFELAPPKYIRD